MKRPTCPTCHGSAITAGNQYRCLECDRYVSQCDCPDRSNTPPAVSNPEITKRLREAKAEGA